jgi:hypothetical protein
MLPRRLLPVFLGPVVALTALGTFAAPAHADGNVVADADLQACLNTEILSQSADAPITAAQLATINRAWCYGANVASLEGMQYLTSATSFNLSPSRVTSLQPIQALTALEAFWIDDNQGTAIGSLAPLAGLTSLKSLFLVNAQVADIGPLAGLFPTLADIVLRRNDISSVAALADYAINPTAEVEGTYGRLVLDENHVTDLSVLSSTLLPGGGPVIGVQALDQRATWTAAAGTQALPVKQLPGAEAKCQQDSYFSDNPPPTFIFYTVCAKTGPLTVTVTGGATYNAADNTITFPSASETKTYTVTWSATASFSTSGGAFQEASQPYFSGTLTITVPGTGTATPTPTPTVTPGPVYPAACHVTSAPVSGPVGRFLDVTAATPHQTDITWLETAGWSQGWSVSCYRTTGTGYHLVRSGGGYTLAYGNDPAGYGLQVDAAYGQNQGTVGYVFQPLSQVARGDAAVWLAQLALSDQAVTLGQPSAIRSYLAGPYSIENTARSRGGDGQWGTSDDATVVTIPVGHALYQEFTDITANFYASDDRHGAAVTFLGNTIVNVRFDAQGNLIAGQRLADGFADGDRRAFLPNTPIARQDMAAFIYRVALFEQQTGQHPTLDLTQAKDIPGYTAHASAVRWLHATGITTGFPDGSFGGLLPVVRQDLAAFIHRADTVIAASA